MTEKKVVEVARKAHISARQAERFFQDAVMSALDVFGKSPEVSAETKTRDAIRDLAQRINATPVLYRVYVAMDGIIPTSLPHRFGGIDFIKGATARREIANPPDVQGKPGATFLERVNRSFVSPTARVEVMSGDPQDAQERGESRIGEAIDVVNFYADLIGLQVPHIRVSMKGERGQPVDVAAVRPGLSTLDVSPQWFPFAFPKKRSALAKRLGYWIASALVETQNRSQVHQRIMRAMRQAGRASVETEPDRALLGYIVALESILMPKNGGGRAVGMHASYVLVDDKVKNKLEERRRVFEEVKDLYDKRSRVAHSGELDVSTEELALARRHAKNAILTILLGKRFNKMSKDEELDQWFKDRPFVG